MGGRGVFLKEGIFDMRYDNHFQIVCTTCGCLSIKIEEPLKSSREAIVQCGDCGAPRGTVGALRDLAVQGYPSAVFPTPSSAPLAADEQMADEPRPTARISSQYAELRRLRQQVKIAEWLASESGKPHARTRVRKTDARPFVHPSPSSRNAYIGDGRDQKRPS
jgi:hypothetical protein